ncbi:hypothetical protein PENARI_c017G11866 [Penicillium arizonense]|uniref:Rhodopsin domain-containing protein n=1 Tax=Penicillium arizonense TaxID=1835702 RepID=A0A1F5LAY1_PENAI|nr:hypothetical protein PENARI_c017G11866 [Penicillium arizonense]OGE50345.1 hypothetical protein PENARI_c017G11866 [Penicillium arizonense]
MVFYGQTVDGIPDRGYILYITALVMVLVAAVFVTARLGTRIVTRQLGLDDICLGLALVSSVVLTAAIDMSVYHGYGRHKPDMKDMNAAMMWFFIAQIPYKIALGFTKVSLVLLYLRIFITKTFQRVGRGYLVVILAWTIASVLVTILQCIPIKASWDKKIVDKKCVDKNSWWYAFAAINTVTDFLIVILPIRPILNLKLSKQDRIGLLCVFGIGAFVCVTSILRTVAVSQTSTGLDQSWDFIPRSTWTLVECNMGIICACLPLLRRPLSFIFPWLFRRGTTRGKSGKSYEPTELQYMERSRRLRATQSQEEILQSESEAGRDSPKGEEAQIAVTTEIRQVTTAEYDAELQKRLKLGM